MRHFRLLSAAAAAVLERWRTGQRSWGTGGVCRGRAERRGSPITKTPVWTFPPPPTQSGLIREGSPPPLARRGAELGSGETTLSTRAVMARAGALTWRLERQGRAKASGSAQTHSAPPPTPPPLPVFLRGYCYPSDESDRAGGRQVLLRRRAQCPDAWLSAGWGGGSCPCLQILAGDVASQTWVGKASGCIRWRDEWRICCPPGWNRVASCSRLGSS